MTRRTLPSAMPPPPLVFDLGLVRVLSDAARALSELSGLGRNQQFLAAVIIRMLT